MRMYCCDVLWLVISDNVCDNVRSGVAIVVTGQPGLKVTFCQLPHTYTICRHGYVRRYSVRFEVSTLSVSGFIIDTLVLIKHDFLSPGQTRIT